MAGLPQFIISTQTDPYWEIPLFDSAGNPLSVEGRVFEAWIAPATTKQGVAEPVKELKILTFQDGLTLLPPTDGSGDQTVKNTFVHQVSRTFAQANFPRGELTADLLEVVDGARRLFAPVRLFYGDPAQIRDFVADRQGITFGQGRQAIITPVAVAGQAGRRGSGLLTGTLPPQPSDGEDGDYWVVEREGQANVVYGPKEAGECLIMGQFAMALIYDAFTVAHAPSFVIPVFGTLAGFEAISVYIAVLDGVSRKSRIGKALAALEEVRG
ncbi:hypothetical protein [Methylobacterium sp. Leaf123]|uniref:hypothetical protein n=1 Tax=Methylobacterium sp. Leaf123 TaxID=1736264 RepID=UPI000B28ED8D|nr:hypothetical protein [Methylobacterium sp. Leaf123]